MNFERRHTATNVSTIHLPLTDETATVCVLEGTKPLVCLLQYGALGPLACTVQVRVLCYDD